MRYQDIIKEYQVTSDTSWEKIPDSAGSLPAGRLACGIVKALQSETHASFWVERDNINIAYASLEEIGDYVSLRAAFVLPEYQGKGVMSELIHWIIRSKHQKIINDTQLSVSGLKLWKGLMRSLTTSIVDISSGQSFVIDDPKSPNPEIDNAQPDFYDKETGIGQRYFYLLEAPVSFKHIVESVEHVYHYDIARHSIEKMTHLPSYFFDGTP